MPFHITPFLDDNTSTFSYLLSDSETRAAAILDPVLDFDPATARVSTDGADRLIRHIQEQELELVWILETHAHADHLSAAMYIKQRLGGRTGIGRGITAVQERFSQIYNLSDFPTDGSQFDHLFDDLEPFQLGNLTGRVIHTPGHTSDSIAYLIEDAAFIGDTLFAPDYGTARADFPGGDARTLYRSIQRLLALQEQTRFFLCHDYTPESREPQACFTRKEQERNIHLHPDVDETSFVQMREDRDAGLNTPRLIIPAIQVNIRAGALPPAEDNGKRYLKLPLDTFGSAPGSPWS